VVQEEIEERPESAGGISVGGVQGSMLRPPRERARFLQRALDVALPLAQDLQLVADK
jgi:hypothetical protein